MLLAHVGQDDEANTGYPEALQLLGAVTGCSSSNGEGGCRTLALQKRRLHTEDSHGQATGPAGSDPEMQTKHTKKNLKKNQGELTVLWWELSAEAARQD